MSTESGIFEQRRRIAREELEAARGSWFTDIEALLGGKVDARAPSWEVRSSARSEPEDGDPSGTLRAAPESLSCRLPILCAATGRNKATGFFIVTFFAGSAIRSGNSRPEFLTSGAGIAA